MSEKIEIPLILDGSEILKALGELKESMIEIGRAAGLSQKDIQEAFQKGAKSAEAYEVKINHVVDAVGDLGDAGVEVKKASKAYEETADKVDEISDAAKQAGSNLEQAGKKGEKSMGGLKGLLGGISKGILAAFAVDKVLEFGKAIFASAAQMQKFATQLRVALGSDSAAADALDMLKNFAKSTPFELSELTEAYIKFANRGIKLTAEELTKLGDLAASQGKSFNQLAEAVLDAGGGEFERLKEFGIKAKDMGDQVALTFKGQTVEVKKNEQAIQQAIIAMGAYNGVAGGMAEQSKTLGGQLSNLEDAVGQLFAAIGSKLAPIFGSALSAIGDLLTGITNFVKDKSIDDLKNEFRAQADEVLNLQSTIVPLAQRYDALTAKAQSLGGVTKLSAAEQAEMKKIISQVVDVVPEAASQFDQYGNAIAITTGKVYDFVAAQQDALKFKNADQLKDVQTTIKSLENSITVLAVTRKKGAKVTADSRGLFEGETKLSAEELKALDKQLKEKNEQLKQANAFRDELSGDALEKRKKQQQADKATLEAERKAQADKSEQEAKDQKAKQDADKNAAKASAEAQKRERERIQSIRDNINLEKELNAARIEMMEAGVKKEVALENERNRAAVADLGFRKLQATSQTEIQTINQLEEIEQQSHTSKLLEINKNYFLEQQQLIQEGKQRITELTLKGQDLELEQEDNNLQQQLEETAKKYKDNYALRLTITSALIEQSETKKKEITEKFATQELNQQHEIDILLAETTIKDEEARNLAILEIRKKYAELRLKQSLGLKSDATTEQVTTTISTVLTTGTADKKEAVLKAQKEIQEIGEGIRTAAAKEGEKNKGIKAQLFSFLKDSTGKSDEEIGQFLATVEEQFKNTLGNIFSALTDAADRQIEEKQRVVDALTDQISEVEDALNKEKDLQEQGLANNVGIKEQELTALKAQKEQAIKDEEEAQKKRQNLAKAQLAIDSITQVQNLITASTNIFSTLSAIPFVGIPLAIGIIASMFGAFAAAKVQAFKMAGSQKFEQGGAIGGKRHSAGGNKYVSIDGGDSTVLEIEEGEFITNRKSTKKYLPLLEAINADTLSGWQVDQFGTFINEGPRMKTETMQELQVVRTERSQLQPITVDKVAREKLTAMDEKLGALLKIKQQEPSVRDMGAYIEEKSGSVTRRIKK